MPDFRVLQCLAVHQLGAETVANPDLTTPDELEGDNMRVRKLRSSVTTSGHTQDACELRQRRLLRFYTPRHPDSWRHRRNTRIGIAPQNPESKSDSESHGAPHVPFASPRGRTTRIVSARVQLVCLQKIGTLRGVQTRF